MSGFDSNKSKNEHPNLLISILYALLFDTERIKDFTDPNTWPIVVKVVLFILWWPVWLHELCHYIPAKLFGYSPILQWDFLDPRVTTHRPGKTLRYREVIIGLSPSAFGLVLGVFWFWFATFTPFFSWMLLLVLISQLGWQLGCLNDFRQSWLIATTDAL